MEEGEGGVCEGETRLSAERYSHKLGGSQSCQPKVGGRKKEKKKDTERREGVSSERRRYLLLLLLLPGWLEGRAWMV